MRITQITANLKCSRFAVLSSALKHSLSQPNSRIYTNHTISQREVEESSTVPTKLLGTTSNQQNRAWNSSPPRRGLRGIIAGPNKTSHYVTVRTLNFRILQPGTSGFSNQLAVSATCAKFGTSGFQIPAMLKCVREAFVSLSTHMGYLSTETKQKPL